MEAQWVEISIFNELLDKTTLESPIKRLSNAWWENYHHNPMKATTNFTDCLMRAGGIKRLPILDTSNSLRQQLESSQIETHNDVLIFKEHFCSKFKKFLIYIIEYNDWFLFTQIGLSQQILALLYVIGYSDCNSLRNVSYITGVTIMKEIYKCKFHCKRSPDSLIEVTSKLKNAIYKYIVQRSLRDKDVNLRIITASELTSWFSDFENEDLKLILCPFLKHIRRNLLDKRRVKNVVLDLLINIYSKSAPNSLTDNYKNLFDAVKSIVFGIIVRKDSILAFKSIQLVTNAVRNFNFSLSCREEEIIFSSLFNKENSVKNEAKKLICDNELLLKVIALYNGCMAKEPAVVHNCLIDHLITRVNWNDWILVITSSQIDDKQAALCLFYEFSKRIVNYESQEAVEGNTALYLKRTFTAEIAPMWMNLVNDDCNKLNSRLLHYLINIFQLFDISLISKEPLKDMRGYILKVFLIEEENFLVNECIQALLMSSDDYSLNINFPVLCSAMFCSIRDNEKSQCLLNLSLYKIILLLKNFVCDNTLWTNLYEHLYNCSPSKIKDVVLVLFNVIIHNRRNCFTLISEDNSEALQLSIQRLKLYVHTFVKFLLRVLASKSSPLFLAETLQLFSVIINHFGSHLSDNQDHYFNFGSIIDDHIPTYVEHYSDIMDKNCAEMKGECCLALIGFGHLIMNFKINISNLQCICHYFSPENKNHSLLFLYTIEMCLKNKPEIGKEIIKLVLNGFIKYINKTVSKKNCEDKHLEQILANKVKFLIEYSETLGKQKYICLFYLQVMALMEEGFSHLMKVKEYLEASLNSNNLKMLQNAPEEEISHNKT